MDTHFLLFTLFFVPLIFILYLINWKIKVENTRLKNLIFLAIYFSMLLLYIVIDYFLVEKIIYWQGLIGWLILTPFFYGIVLKEGDRLKKD